MKCLKWKSDGLLSQSFGVIHQFLNPLLQVRSVCRKITLWTLRRALRSNWWCWLTAGCRRLTAGSPSACWTWTTTRQCSNTAATEQLSGRGKRTTPTLCRYEYLNLSNTQQVYRVLSHDKIVLITIPCSRILQVFASDADSGMNGQIEFSIVSGNPNEAFILDSVRGILATNVVLDREITHSYK